MDIGLGTGSVLKVQKLEGKGTHRSEGSNKRLEYLLEGKRVK